MSEQLKPCPFCAGEDLTEVDDVRIRCWDCGASGPTADDGGTADDAWDRREPDPSWRELVRWLREGIKINEEELGCCADSIAEAYSSTIEKLRELGVAAVREEVVHAGDKWRAKRLMVLPGED